MVGRLSTGSPVACDRCTGNLAPFGVVAVRLFTEAHFCEFRIADHQVTGDERHFHAVFPFGVDLRAGTRGVRRVVVLAFWAVGFHPSEGFGVFGLVILTLGN